MTPHRFTINRGYRKILLPITYNTGYGGECKKENRNEKDQFQEDSNMVDDY